MKTLANSIVKFFASNLAVIVAIGLLPVFLVTDDVALFQKMMDFIFGSES